MEFLEHSFPFFLLPFLEPRGAGFRRLSPLGNGTCRAEEAAASSFKGSEVQCCCLQSAQGQGPGVPIFPANPSLEVSWDRTAQEEGCLPALKQGGTCSPLQIRVAVTEILPVPGVYDIFRNLNSSSASWAIRFGLPQPETWRLQVPPPGLIPSGSPGTQQQEIHIPRSVPDNPGGMNHGSAPQESRG